MAKIAIFVDGENFRYSLIQLFPDLIEYLPKRVEWFKLFNSVISSQEELLRVYWYVVELLDFRPFKFPDFDEPEKIERILRFNPHFDDELNSLENEEEKNSYMFGKISDIEMRRKIIRKRFDGWRKVQDGISTYIDFLEFRRSGSIRFNLLSDEFESEKGVDVNLASDMISLNNSYDKAIIFSGDQDYIPAICRCKDMGKHVMSVNFTTKTGKLLPGSAYRLKTICDKIITIEYDKIEQFIQEF